LGSYRGKAYDEALHTTAPPDEDILGLPRDVYDKALQGLVYSKTYTDGSHSIVMNLAQLQRFTLQGLRQILAGHVKRMFDKDVSSDESPDAMVKRVAKDMKLYCG
jgi:hypothetical protein